MSVISGTGKSRADGSQPFLRTVNEHIEDVHERLGVEGPTEFLCECGDPECSERVFLSLHAYNGVRANLRRFVVVPGHETPNAERVVERGERFAVVEKFGASAEVAVQPDPRASRDQGPVAPDSARAGGLLKQEAC